MWATFKGFTLFARVVIVIAVVLLVAGLSISAYSSVKRLIFGDPAAHQLKAQKVVDEANLDAVQAISKVATDTTVQTYERRTQVGHIVQGGRDAVNSSYKGGQIDADVDAAGAAALCRLHDSLCRRPAPAALSGLRPVVDVGPDTARDTSR